MYLHERQDWTNFTWDDRVVAPLLSEVRFAQGAFLARVESLGFEVNDEIEVDAISEEVISSSMIEGVELNPAEVRSSVAKRLGITLIEPTTESSAVEGAVSMMIDATQNFSDPLTYERLCGWHNALFPTGYSGLYKIETGTYRTSPMSVVSGAIGHEKIHYEAPDAVLIPALMDEFLDWFNSSGEEPLVKAAIAHLWFLTIHPFDDGNGRIARALTEMLLARSDNSRRRYYSMAAYVLAHRKDYYATIETTQKSTNDVTAWVIWFLEALRSVLEENDQKVSAVLRRAAWWHEVADIQMNERQRKVLHLLLGDFQGKLTSGKWAKLCKVSSDTALRDINDLINKGLLKRDESAGGRSTSYALVMND